MIGRTISRYKILSKLGEGGMGVVYSAQDQSLNRPVALKFLARNRLGDEDARKRFRREAEASAGVNHPNVCQVYEIDEADGETFIVMALAEGEPLDRKIAAGPLELPTALAVAAETARGLEAAHGKGVVHRDIKPANLIVSAAGRVTITDFGLALLANRSKLTRTDQTMGTVAYMSPEQTHGGDVDRRTDIWSLGVVLYEMIVGLPPFRGDYDQAVIYSLTNEPPEPITGLRTGVPMELEWAVGKCLAKDPGERYQTATELLVDLTALEKKRPAAVTRAVARQAEPLRSSNGDTAVQRASLRGLQTLEVAIEADSDALRDAIRTEAELKLRMAGLEVAPSQESHLHIGVQQLQTSGARLHAVKVELNQSASLTRDAAIFLPVRTWYAEQIGLAGDDRVGEGIVAAARELIDQFVNAYLAVNSK